jgi:hypothetical protein
MGELTVSAERGEKGGREFGTLVDPSLEIEGEGGADEDETEHLADWICPTEKEKAGWEQHSSRH